MDKWSLRRMLRGKAVPEKDSIAICSALSSIEKVAGAGILFLYHPLPDEVDIRPLYGIGPRIALPSMEGNSMFFRLYTGGLVRGAYGVMEATGAGVEPDEDSVMVIPALAFRSDGVRLGRGLGCYDRYMQGRRVFTIGVVSSSRILDFDAEDHDLRVDMLVTEKMSAGLPDGSPDFPSCS